MKIAFLCNPSARWKKKFPLLIRKIQESVPAEKEIFLIDRVQSDSMETHLAKILDNNFDRIVIVGGDGTLNRLVNVLSSKSGIGRYSLGIVPVGTCNDFARNLGYRPSKIVNALRSSAEGSLRRINIAKVGDRRFINNAGFGKKNPSLNQKNPIKVIREMSPVRLRAAWEGGSLEGSFFMMLCANAPYFSGGLHFSRRSDPSDDTLEFYFVRKSPKINLALQLLFGRAKIPLHIPHFTRNIACVQTPRLTIRTEEPVSIVADGEPVSEMAAVRKATFEISGSCSFVAPQ